MLYFEVYGLVADMLVKYRLFILLTFSMFLFNISFAIEEVDFDVERDISASAANKADTKILTGQINYDDILQKAEAHSYDLKLADFDVFIAKTDIKSARADYFPKIYAGASSEYNKSFNDILSSTYVGETYVNPYTRFQSLFGLTLSYNIFDFGVRRGYLDMAKEDTNMKQLIEKGQLIELRLNVTDLYSKILLTKKQIDLNEKILALSENNLSMKKRLYNAKELSKSELNNEVVENKKVKRKLFELKAMLGEYLNYLGFYTNEEYDIENLTASDINRPDINPFEFDDYTKSITYDIQNAAIAKKEQELKIVRRSNFPKFNLYSRYYLYDSHTSNYLKTLGIEPSNYSIGASVNMPVFDGLRNSADIEKARLELEKLYVERDKAIAELKNKISTLRTNYSYMNEQIENSRHIIKELKETEQNTGRMLKKGLVSPIDLTQAKIDLLQEEIEYEKNNLTSISILKAIEILTTYDKG